MRWAGRSGLYDGATVQPSYDVYLILGEEYHVCGAQVKFRRGYLSPTAKRPSWANVASRFRVKSGGSGFWAGRPTIFGQGLDRMVSLR